MRPLLRALVLVLAALAIVPRGAAAQVRPDLDWRTIRTTHFRIHHTPELEELARRTAANAEWAWGELARELKEPRGPVEIVVADNVDYANGYATPFPTNRIVIYARPPVEEMALRNHADWNRLLITHELTHIFHLDRVRGLWATAQKVFGRAAPTFPNAYAPSWILEGLAVHYETKLTGGGRLAGTEFPMYVRAAALDSALPTLDAASRASPQFPGGNRAYLYGSFAVSRSDTARMGRYVEVSSRRLIPWRHDANAREAFGVSFTARWAAWRDSVMRANGPAADGMRVASSAGDGRMASSAAEASRTLTQHGFTARFPRFTSDDALVYVADDARQTTGLYAVTLDGARTRLGRRNTVDVNSPARDLQSVQAEIEFADPYTLHNDLFTGSGLRRRRLTRGERMSAPDVHAASGAVVAVRTDPGTTSLVFSESAADFYPRELVRGTLDRTWAEPRFSRDGQRIAAVRWERGGRSAVVVLDRQGRALRSFAPRTARIGVVSSPVWEPGDSTLLFVSDHEGRAMVYRGDVRTGAYGRVWASATGLNTPDVSPNGRRMAAVELRADGYHVVVRETPRDVALTLPAADTAADPLRAFDAAPLDREPLEQPYSPWELLYPSWWLPVISTTGPGTLAYGAMSSATDPVGQHAWAGEFAVEPAREELTARLSYAWAGLGVPVFAVEAYNEWQHGVVRGTNGAFLGYLGARSQGGAVDVIFDRPRVRLSSYLVVGAEVEANRYRTYPGALLAGLGNDALLRTQHTHAFRALVGVSTMQRPGNAVSVEDGVSATLSHRARFGVGVQFEDVTETIVAASAAKSLPLPGYARHVLAVRGAYGVTGHRTTATFDVGGVSGSSLEVVPGVAIGGSRRTFGVRGFTGGTLLGVRAAAGSVEYRAPLALVGRGVKLLPLFLQKSSVTAFADAGSAWCEFAVGGSFICPDPLPARTTIASVGAELGLDASLQYDVVYRFRVGVAHPVRGAPLAPRSNTFYFSLGSAF